MLNWFKILLILCILFGYLLISKYWDVQIYKPFCYNNIIKIVDVANSKLRFPKCTFASVYNIEMVNDTDLRQNTMVIKRNIITINIARI